MTREEAIAELNKAIDEISLGSYTYDGFERSTALEIGIKALEQEPVLDKIRAEIEKMPTDYCGGYVGLDKKEVLQIIDKYKAESEDKE